MSRRGKSIVTTRTTNPFEDHSPPSTSTTTRNPFEQHEAVAPQLQRQHHQQQQLAAAHHHHHHHHHHRPGSNPFDSDDEHVGGDDGTDDDLQAPAVTSTIAAAESMAVSAAAVVSAEASWQYLGDLPYRRIPIYQNVRWTDSSSSSSTSSSSNSKEFGSSGLAQFPASLFGTTTTTATTTTTTANNKLNNALLDAREMRQWIQTSTVTQVEGCPHGGPIAAVTLPLYHRPGTTTTNKPMSTTNSSNAATAAARFTSTEVRILSNAGQLLAKIPFPQRGGGPFLDSTTTTTSTTTSSVVMTDTNPTTSNMNNATTATTTNVGVTTVDNPNMTSNTNNAPIKPGKSSSNINSNTNTTMTNKPVTPFSYQRFAGDIFKIGFTERGILVVLMRDSLCFTYDTKGDAVLPPFFLVPPTTATATSTIVHEVVRAHIYGHGVACLTQTKQVAICEFLHDTLDAAYYGQGAHITSRVISAVPTRPHQQNNTSSYNNNNTTPLMASNTVALVTPLTVAYDWCSTHFKSFRTVAVLPRHCTSHGRPEVFLSTDDCSVVIVVVGSSMDLTDVDCRHRLASPIVDMSFCPNGRFLACFTEANMLTVMSTTFETKVLDFDTSEGSSSPPLAMQWCGEDSVVLHWKNMGILMVGPYGDWLRFPYSNTASVHLIPEIDACRVITDSTVELLQRVPPITANLLRIGSIEGSALLLEAADAFGAGSVSDDVLIKDNPPTEEDIAACIEAATKEFDIVVQKRLLRAASYGMQYLKQKQASDPNASGLILGGPLELHPHEHNFDMDHPDSILPSATTRLFVAAARKLRILNALRNPQVGFILTVTQYDALTPAGVLTRLVSMRRPALATRLAVYLRLPKSIQLYCRAAKAAAYVQNVQLGTLSDSMVAEKAIAIIQQEQQGEDDETGNESFFAKHKNSSTLYRGAYAAVAMAATRAGSQGVASNLLMLETSVSDKVAALIFNGSFIQAMAVATLAHDGDYIFSTLMELEKDGLGKANHASEIAKQQSKFWQVVINKLPPEALHTLRRYYAGLAGCCSPAAAAAMAGDGGGGGALGLLMRAQRHADAGIVLGKRALVEEDHREQQGILQEASQVYGIGKETAFYKICTDDYMELLNYQELIRTKYGAAEVAPPSSSVTATVVSVLNYAATHVREQHRLLADADRIAKKFRIPERRLWHIKVKAFSESGQWSNLRLLADSRTKSPIGYAPFARAAIRGKQPATEILKYVEKISAWEERCDLLTEAGMWKRALEEAIRARDIQRILNVKTRCQMPELQMQAEQALAKL